MTELERLGARLRGGWTALLVAAGCTGVPEGPGTKQGESAIGATAEPKTVAKAEPTAEPTKTPPAPVLLDVPTCPRGTWSGPAALAVKIQLGDARKDGCPVTVEHLQQALDAGEAAQLDGLPPRVFATLDEAATRQAGDGRCAYRWVEECPGGRVLLGAHGPVLAAVREGAGWTAEPTERTADAALAEAWSLDARTEHASVASFARATLELLAVGAPAALVHATQQASLDEVEHARLCFALASRYAGKQLGPGPLAVAGPRAAALVRLACDVFVEGCVGETVAALAAARALRRCEDGEVRRVLERIEEDEAQHAALAWATLGWACERGGESVRAAVWALAAAMRAEVRAAAEAPVDVRAAALAVHGRLDAAGQQACVRDAWDGLIAQALAETVGPVARTGDSLRA